MCRSLDDILTALGGDAAVAARLGCTSPAISNWKVRGVPPRRQIALVRLAAMLKLRPRLTLDEMEAASDASISAGRVSESV